MALSPCSSLHSRKNLGLQIVDGEGIRIRDPLRGDWECPYWPQVDKQKKGNDRKLVMGKGGRGNLRFGLSSVRGGALYM